MKNLFRRFASRISQATGSAGAFVLAFSIIIVWAVTGPIFNFSSTWQLFINTTTTIVTFLMVFLIQNTQNRDSKAMQLKLDELIRAGRGRDSFMDIEDLTDEDLAAIDDEFRRLHDHAEVHPAVKKLHNKIAHVRAKRNPLAEVAHELNDIGHIKL